MSDHRIVRRAHTHALAATIAACLSVPAPKAAAQQAGGIEPGDKRGLEEVVVTARKREETVQTTPVSIAVFSGETLRAQSLDSFNELNDAVPNVQINGGIPNGGGSAAQIFIRGVGQDDYSFPNEPGVGLYIDDVYIARSAAGDFGFMDVERIEILRGPQGTLYGRNTIGGAVKVITRKPTGETGGEVGVTVGDYSRLDVYGNFEFPISDTVAAKLAASSRQRDGLGHNFIGQDLGEEDEVAARGTLRFQPSESLDILFQADYQRQRQAGPAGSMVFFQPNDATEGLVNGILAPPRAEELGLEPPFDRYGDAWVKTLDACDECVYDSGGTVETRDWADIWGVALTVEWNLGEIDLKSVTAYRDADIDIRRDSEHTPFNVVQVDNPEETSQLTEELQLTGRAFDDRLDWVVGAFGLIENGESYLYAPLLSGLYDAIGVDLTALINTDYDAFSVALFGEGTYALTDRLGITAGARLTHDDKEYVYGLVRPESGAEPLPPTTLSDDWTEFLPKIGLEFNATDDVMWFANISRGYKAGGYNSRALSGLPPQAYDPEFITAYEIGVKSRLADGLVTLNASAFYNDYEDIQLLSVLDLGGGNVETVISNAGQGRIIGGEVEMVALPVPSLELGLGLGVLDTKYEELDQSVIDAGISKSNKFINAPDLSANAYAQYAAMLGDFGSLTFRVDAAYRDEQYRDAPNTPQLKADSYTIVDARITLQPVSENWEASVFVTNLTDEIYVTNGVSVLGLGYVEAYYSRPREWGAALLYRF